MKEDETIVEFQVLLRGIVKKLFALGEKISKEKLTWKIIRSLTKIFDMKITTIEETQDVRKLKVDELIGSLLTFEITMANLRKIIRMWRSKLMLKMMITNYKVILMW